MGYCRYHLYKPHPTITINTRVLPLSLPPISPTIPQHYNNPIIPMNTQTHAANKTILLLLIIGLVFAAVNMRSPLVMLGSVVPLLEQDLGLSATQIGYLGALPMPLFALGALFSPMLARRFGLNQMMIAMTALLTLGVAVRVWFGVGFLFLGTLILSFAIGILNALTAPFIKHCAPNHITLATGVFSLSMSVLAGFAAWVVVPMADVAGWQLSMSVWAAFGALAALIWFGIYRVNHHAQAYAAAQHPATFNAWRTLAAWQIAVLMGLQSFLFYTVASFLPSIAMSFGYELSASTQFALLFQLMAPVAILLMTYLIKRGLSTAIVGLIGSVCNFLGVVGLLYAPDWMVVWSAVMGFGCAVIFTLCLMLFSLRTTSTEHARDLSGMVQAVGYFIAMCGPLMMGKLFEHFGDWYWALIAMSALMLINIPMGIWAGSSEKVDQSHQ